MTVWRETVHRGRNLEDRDADRVEADLKVFLLDNPTLGFGGYSTQVICNVAWELAANAAKWSQTPSASVVLESGSNGAVCM